MVSDLNRQSERYAIGSEVQLRAVIFRTGSLDPIEVELADVSSNGIRLRVPVCLQFEEPITVHIFTQETDYDLELSALVKWLRPTEQDDWFVGCRVMPAFSEEALSHLASLGCVERRGGPRREVQLSATVWGEAEKTKKLVTLHNLSEDGFGMLAPEPCVVPQRITVRLQNSDDKTMDVIAQVEWQIKASEGYLCGCSFANAQSYSRLYELIETDSDGVELPKPERDKPSRKESLWVALAVMVVFVFPSLFVLSQEVASDPDRVAAQSHESIGPTSGKHADKQPADEHVVAATPVAEHPAMQRIAPTASPSRQLTETRSAPPPQNAVRIESVSFEFRTWIDSTGQHRAVARLLSVKGDTVRLEKEDGQLASVTMDRLSAADAQYVRQHLALSE